MLLETTPLRFLRQLRGITLNQLSRITGISEGHLCKLEFGRVKLSRKQTVERLAEALKIDPRALQYPTLVHSDEYISLEQWDAMLGMAMKGNAYVCK